MTRRGVAVLVLCLGACAAPDCDPDCDFDFGHDCSVGEIRRTTMNTFEGCRALCGVSVTAGEAEVGTSFHPGEHALVVQPGARVLLEPPLFGDEWVGVSMLWQCEEGGHLFVQGTELPSSDIARRTLTGLSDWDSPELGDWERGALPLVRVEGSAPCWVDDVVASFAVTSCGGGWFDPPPDAGPDAWP